MTVADKIIHLCFSLVIGSLIFTRKKKAMQIFPAVLRRFWNEWEIQALVLLGLIIQSILTVMGNRRKYLASHTLSFILWFAYLLADWFAAFSLSVLSKNAGNFEDPKFALKVFWAQFFLLYLGGPDTITAYSLEDNNRVMVEAVTYASFPDDDRFLCLTQSLKSNTAEFSGISNVYCRNNQDWGENLGFKVC